MSSFRFSRRATAVLAAVALATIGLVALPAASASAYSHTSSRGKLLQFINDHRSANLATAWNQQQLQDAYTQGLAQYEVDCGGCDYGHAPGFEFGTITPSFFHASSSTSAGRLLKIENLVAANGSQIFGTGTNFVYGSVGYATKGSKVYAVVAGFAYDSGNDPYASVASGSTKLTGSVRVGSTVGVSTPKLSPTPTAHNYQWTIFQNGSSHVVGTNSPTYTPQGSDLGGDLAVSVESVRTGSQTVIQYSGYKTIGHGVYSHAKLTVGGERYVGMTLAATVSASPAPSSMQYQWYRNDKKITNVGNTYLLTHADEGKRIDASVKIGGVGFISQTLRTHTTHKVKPQLVNAPTVAPSLSTSTPSYGAKLSVQHGTWDSGVTFTYQWYRGSTAISGATKSSYTPKASDIGHNLKAKVTGHQHDRTAVSASTPPSTEQVSKGVFVPQQPTITGTDTPGHTLTGHVGTWKPTPSSYRYTWYRNDTIVKMGSSKTYALTDADLGYTITFQVTAFKHDYVPYSYSSDPVSIVG